MAVLSEGQYELVDPVAGTAFQFGRHLPALVTTIDYGTPALTVNDAAAPRSDGSFFGRDYRGGRTISFDGSVLTEPSPTDALDALGPLSAAWLGDGVRSVPGATAVLRWCRGGRLRRVYGRPRRFAAATGYTRQGWIPWVADFQTIDHLYYGDDDDTVTVPYAPVSLGGLIGPQIGPWIATTAGEASGVVSVGGDVPAWLAWTVHGPIVNPTIEVVDRWSATLQTSLAFDQSITVDPVPWTRSVRGSGGGNYAGALTAASVRASQMTVPPGTAQVLLRGIDPTGTSSLSVTVRSAWASF